MEVKHGIASRNPYSTDESVIHAIMLAGGNPDNLLHLDDGEHQPADILHIHGSLKDISYLDKWKNIVWSVYTPKDLEIAKRYTSNIICHSFSMSRNYDIERVRYGTIAGKREYKGNILFIDLDNPISCLKAAIYNYDKILALGATTVVAVPFDKMEEAYQQAAKYHVSNDILKIIPFVPAIHILIRECSCILTTGLKTLIGLANKVPSMVYNHKTQLVMPVFANGWEIMYNSDFYPTDASYNGYQNILPTIFDISYMYEVDLRYKKMIKDSGMARSSAISELEKDGYEYKVYIDIARKYMNVFDHVINNFAGEALHNEYDKLYRRITEASGSQTAGGI